MSVIITKELGGADDLVFGFGSVVQTRGNILAINSGVIPFSLTESIEDALNARSTTVVGDNRWASIFGSPAHLFRVADAISADEAVNKGQLDTEIGLKADKLNVLELDNNTPFAPLFDYNPTTKKYVDDSIYTAFQSGVSGSFTSADGKTITVTGGLITGII